MPPETPRWFYRFDNYKRAFNLLRQAIETQQQRELTQLEKEGVIQRFEYTWELAWKVLKDYLESEGQVLPTITPAAVIRAAHAAKIIDHGDIWMRGLDARNRMAHTYDIKSFEQVIAAIAGEYLSVLDALHLTLLEKSLEARNA
jgi:hypothetical protein